MAKNAIPSYADLNKAIKAVADIPSKVDDEGFVIADGVSLTKNVYDPKNGNYELHVRDVKNNKWKSFDNYDNANCIEDAAKCFVDFYKARSTSESHKCSMAKKIESLSKKKESISGKLLLDPEKFEQAIREVIDGEQEDILKSVDDDERMYYEMAFETLGESDYDYAGELYKSLQNDMFKYVSGDDYRIMGNFNNIEWDWENAHKDGIKFRDLRKKLLDGVNDADTDEFSTWAIDWFFDTFGTYNMCYKYHDTVSDLAYSYKQEDEENGDADESKRKGRCSMAKKIESLRKRSEGIDDVVNQNAAAASGRYNNGLGRYGKAQDILNYNKKNYPEWKQDDFLREYVRKNYKIHYSGYTRGDEERKIRFEDKKLLQDFIDLAIKYSSYYGRPLTQDNFKIGRSVATSPIAVKGLVDDIFEKCPEWKKAYDEYLGTTVRGPIKDLKREVDYERSRSPEYNKYLTDIADFKAELTDVIRNAVKLRTEVNYYPPRHEDDTEPFRVAIDGGFNDSASKSVTKVLNDLNAKFNPVPGGQRVDKDAAAEVLAALEASLS